MTQRKFHVTQEQLVGLYIVRGLSTYKIARMYSVDRSTVCNALKRYGISVKPRRKLPTIQEIERLYFAEHKTLAEIGELFGVTGEAVGMELRKCSIGTGATRPGKERKKHTKPIVDSSVCYSRLHQRVENTFGKPNHCSLCGRDDVSTKYEWHNINGRWEDVTDYIRLCAKCHKRTHAELRKSKLGELADRRAAVEHYVAFDKMGNFEKKGGIENDREVDRV